MSWKPAARYGHISSGTEGERVTVFMARPEEWESEIALTPEQAREFALDVLRMADHAEGFKASMEVAKGTILDYLVEPLESALRDAPPAVVQRFWAMMKEVAPMRGWRGASGEAARAQVAREFLVEDRRLVEALNHVLKEPDDMGRWAVVRSELVRAVRMIEERGSR